MFTAEEMAERRSRASDRAVLFPASVPPASASGLYAVKSPMVVSVELISVINSEITVTAASVSRCADTVTAEVVVSVSSMLTPDSRSVMVLVARLSVRADAPEPMVPSASRPCWMVSIVPSEATVPEVVKLLATPVSSDDSTRL